MLETDETGPFVGRKLDEHCGAFYLEYPMDKGAIRNWDAMEHLWEVRSFRESFSLLVIYLKNCSERKYANVSPLMIPYSMCTQNNA